MAVFASLLRGINVGGHKPLKMDALKALYASLGLGDVQSLLQSGNLVFRAADKDTAAIAVRIEDAIESEYGFRPAVILRNPAELRATVAKNPLREHEDDPSKLAVIFLAAAAPKGAEAKLAKAYSGPEAIRVAGREVYLYYPDGMGRSKLTNAFLEKRLGVTGTARNWNTVTKLLALIEALGK